MPAKLTALIAVRDGEGLRMREVRGYTTPTLGLFVHRDSYGDPQGGSYDGDGWTVSHLKSGRLLMGGFDTRARALRFAERVAALADWTLPRSRLGRLRGLRDRLYEVAREVKWE